MKTFFEKMRGKVLKKGRTYLVFYLYIFMKCIYVSICIKAL